MSTSSFELLVHGINLTRSVLRAVSSGQDIAYNQDIPDKMKIYAIAARILGLSFSVYETNAIIHESSAEEMMRIKQFELAEKSFELGSRLAVSMYKSKSFKSTMESVEQEILPGVLDFIRVASEGGLYTEKYYLEMSPEERAKHTRTVIERTGSGMNMHIESIVEKPIDEEECLRNIEVDDAASFVLSSAMLLLEGKHLSNMCNSFARDQEPIYNIQQLAADTHRAQRPQQQVRPAPRPVLPSLAELHRQRDNQDPSDLLSLSYIPSNFYVDDDKSIFNKYICSISHLPCRHPVQDPTTQGDRKVIYDHINILTWLQAQQDNERPMTSPVTRQPLEPDQLVSLPASQRLIDTKLQSFQESWLKLLDDHPELKGLPDAPDLQHIVEAARTELGPEYFDNSQS